MPEMHDQPQPGRTSVPRIASAYGELLLGHWPRLLALYAIGWALVTGIYLLQADVFGYHPRDLGIFFELDILPIAYLTAAVAQATLWGQPGDPVRACLEIAGRAFVSVLAVTVLARIAITVGLVTLVIPGIAAMILFGLSAVIMMAERPGIIAAMSDSVQRVWSNFSAVLISYLIYVLSLIAFVFASGFTGAVVTAFLPGGWDQHVMGGALSAALSVSHTVFAVAVYRAIVAAELEGAD